jgi:hypothetical protein
MSATAKSTYPLQMLDRPFTMPKNSFQSSLQFKNSAVGIMSTEYGITDDLELGLSWGGMSTSGQHLQPEMNMTVNLAYFLFSKPYASGMVNFSLPFYFESQVLHKASFALTTSVPLVRGHLGLLLFYDDLVALDWSKETLQASFNFPVRLNWQATDQFYLKLGTSLGTLNTAGPQISMIDKTPLKLEALFAVTKSVDLLGSFGFANVQQPKNIVMMLGISVRGGELDG